jgi:hypothetical protein
MGIPLLSPPHQDTETEAGGGSFSNFTDKYSQNPFRPRFCPSVRKIGSLQHQQQQAFFKKVFSCSRVEATDIGSLLHKHNQNAPLALTRQSVSMSHHFPVSGAYDSSRKGYEDVKEYSAVHPVDAYFHNRQMPDYVPRLKSRESQSGRDSDHYDDILDKLEQTGRVPSKVHDAVHLPYMSPRIYSNTVPLPLYSLFAPLPCPLFARNCKDKFRRMACNVSTFEKYPSQRNPNVQP